ncbi:MAG: hypothetical protein FJ313_03580 [Gemmatimonadetes bacterium]|nr:hypothetical protein [Gemmatimonadota bacterium]
MTARSARLVGGRSLAAAAGLFVLLAAVPPPAGRGDEPSIRLLGASARSELPNGVRFTVEAESTAPITDIRVRFTIGGRRASQYAYLDVTKPYRTETAAGLLLRTDTLDRYIPPGSLISYSFEITDESGGVLETEPEELVLLDSRLEWDRVEAGGVTVHYVLSEKRARDIAEAMWQTMLTMGPLLGAEIETPVNVTMYNNYADMIGALPPKSSTISRELITEGQAFTDENVLLVLGGGTRALGTASHEVTHILVGRAVHGSPFGIATWLNEGLAEYGNVDPGISYDRFLEWAIDTGRLMPLEQLERFPGDPNMVIVCYGQSRSVVAYMVKTYGPEKMAALMVALGRGDRLRDALIEVYGLSIRELDDEWRASVGAAPLPEKQEAALPTPVPALPTLVPYSLTPVAGGEQLAPPTPTAAPAPEPTATPAPEPTATPAVTGGGCSRAGGAAALDAFWVGMLTLLGLGGAIRLLRRR